MSGLRVILGAKAESLHDVRLPCFASYKLDGWRALWQGMEFFTRSGKTLPNRQLRAYASTFLMNRPGWDGEIIVGEPNARDVFSRTDSFCKRAAALISDDVRFFVFDNACDARPFSERNQALHDCRPFVVKLEQYFIERYEELERFEAKAVAEGYEGIVCRAPMGRYKNGRSTLKEQYLVKVKRYIDEEVTITGFEELKHNANPSNLNELGYSHRSSHQEGKIAGNVLGALIVDWRGRELRVGTGFDWSDRVNIWSDQSYFLGKRCTIKYSPAVKELPRQPVFKGIRSDL
jgi:DNA ligase-1